MQLTDFNLSTIDLHPSLKLFWEHAGQQLPITDLQVQPGQLQLSTDGQTPLTLDQFRARVQQVSGHANLFIAGSPPQRLYGYRLVPHQILFG
ncbi:hypothetical protein ACFQET_03885 [Levilactobacillus tangyuanensis]|uniref:Uncharacterized protein n=1 Tax=Levilactobacillus tangyuanensis TaxID=2486021 RepID=A0ABW1TLR9_9LACO|nr:hypothetical protein [Levilactobacillus tangyuanensis]